MKKISEVKKIAKNCLKCKQPSCVKHCPINNPIPEILSLIEKDDIDSARNLLFNNSNGSIICSKLCDFNKQCYGNCVLSRKGKGIKFYEVEDFLSKSYEIKMPKKVVKKSKVAIIGAGISGISLAIDLKTRGYDVTIFEKKDKLGGVLTDSIPNFRFDESHLDKYYEILNSLKINVLYNKEWGVNLKIENLTEYKFIVFAMGTYKSKKTLPVHSNVLDSLSVLQAYKNNIEVLENKNVIVIGGGDVAIDVARTLKRTNNNVSIVYRRDIKNAPASFSEIELAISEGVNFKECLAPVDLILDNDVLVGLRVEKMNLVKDPNSTRLTFEKTNEFMNLDCEYIVEAVGLNADYQYTKEVLPELFNEKVCRDENMKLEKNNQVFMATGDYLLGASSFVKALKQAKNTLNIIESYCQRVVFGGSFNPVTIAHESIISELSKRFDEVILVPNGNKYTRKDLIDDKDRVKMLEIVSEKFDNVVISDIELKRNFGGTIQTLNDLNNPYFAIGDDCLFDLKTWIKSDELVSNNKFIVFTRDYEAEDIEKKIKQDEFLSKYSSHFTVIKIDFANVSSSKFRETHNFDMITSNVAQYIKEKELYSERGKAMFKNNYLKVAIATPKVYLGKPMENAKEIINIMNNNEEAVVILFPELSLTGYSIGDWLFNSSLLNETLNALKYLVDNSSNQIMIVGLPLEYCGGIYNCAAVIQNKKILGIIPKITMPRTGEFNETRYFVSGKKIVDNNVKISLFNEEVDFGSLLFKNKEYNVCFGVEICGDFWGQKPPHEKLFQKGADIVLNLSASTFYLGKDKVRRVLVNNASEKFKGAYIYTSCGPSDTTSDITFTGHQMVYSCGDAILDVETKSLDTVVNMVDIDLETIRHSRYSDGYSRDGEFVEENFINFDLTMSKEYKLNNVIDKYPFVPKSEDQFEEIIDIVSLSLIHRLNYIGIKKVVLGISGGLDSTLALLFVYNAFKKYKISPKNIIAITMPGFGTGSKSKNIALHLMEKLGVDNREISIKKEAIQQLKMLNHDLETKDITYENVQARIRTMLLMNTANKEGGIVIGTGDMSEIALGWSTFNADQMAMYNVNSGLPKTTVKALVKYFITKYPELKSELTKVYNAIISPELTGSDQSTEDRIGKYEINDFIMYHIFGNGASKERIAYLLNELFGLDEETANNYYDNFMRRFNRNQYKRLAGPEGIKIFKLSLCPRGDLRYPGDMK